ncbi:MAG: putative Fe-S oxidoreductase [Candidatus Magnetoglobus multicellularis str. Araruama]|uniref:Putative Fe-S oxidoreductase n=1 Tax=Candidatus Magnetoglobus multicellularis str. Araruama TaxID=890399 RepID=A0A1V1PFV3_9BACT|nr:MAG: putative Fe-S oxidoreductase [Candidatus Magnetoglobus multicellularis str. Araruama]
MNILLLNPPGYDHKFFIREGRCNQEQGVWGTIWPPITLATSAAMLENKGYFVDVLDCSAQKTSLDHLLHSVRRNTYQLIIWTVGTPSIKKDLELADKIKQIKPEIRTAIVGTHATALPDDCLINTAGLDFVIRNEPEETILALTECISLNKSIKEVSGISYKTQNGKVIHNIQRSFIKDLDSLPFPAWHYLDLNNYKLPLIGKKFVILSPVRGCPFSCIFCTAQSYYGKQLRKRSPERMIDEIIHNYKTYNVDHFFIWADTFTADKKYVMKFCQLIIEKKLRIKWTCNSRVDTVSEVLLNIMAKAGCWMISYGIESGNQHILDAIQKKLH